MSNLYETTDVVALLIGRDGRLLLDYNEPWSAFCLPITKIRDIPPKVPNGQGGRETPVDAAVRAAVEVLGVPLSVDRFPKAVETEIQPYHQSGRDGQWRRYQFHLFAMKINFEPHPLPGHWVAWLKPDEIATHHPMSPTMKPIFEALDAKAVAKLLA